MLTWKLLHLLLFVYWLGADVGTFYASRFVADAALAPPARATAARIMLGIDLLPRICMPLVLATGVQLASMLGVLAIGAAGLAGVWALSLGWLAMVLVIHQRGAGAARLARLDFGVRIVIVALLVAATLVLPALPAWTTLKLLGFAATVVCGLMIRVHLKPFGPAFAQLMAGGRSDEPNRIIAASIARCVPYVIAIWIVLIACAAAGLHLIP